jgi:DMSO/TMAO reductase YedYZ molybdopterin-dependent catalytic subunit
MIQTPQTSVDSGQVLARLNKDSRLIPRDRTNFESRPDLFSGLVTPNELFFIRSNGPVSVEIDPDTWRLNVAGQVERELSLSLADLQAMPARTVTAFLECSGNSRSRFPADPAPVEGTSWDNGAVGNATWTGTSLANVLEQAGIRNGAVEVVSQGGDFEGMRRSLPIDVARDPDVLLAWEMNSQPLPAPHGGPVRLLVPGWGAIASTKWLSGLDVINYPFEGHYQTDLYVLYDERGAPTGPVTRMPVKSLITVPQGSVAVTRGRQTIIGYAWSGYGGVATVEVSTDGGRTWAEADIVDEAGPYSWVRFACEWDAEPGPALLQSRATDAEGNTQPERAIWNAKGYQMNGIYEIPVFVQV